MNIKGKIRIDSRAFISKENEDTEQTAAADRARASLIIVGECMMELVIFSEARRCGQHRHISTFVGGYVRIFECLC